MSYEDEIFELDRRSVIFKDIKDVMDKIDREVIDLNEGYRDYKKDFKSRQVKLRREVVIKLREIIMDYEDRIRGLETMGN